MKLFNINGNSLERVYADSFKLEKDIQELVEKNTETLFGFEFVKSEFTVDTFRLDTLCYDEENQSFTIIEYKKDKNFSVIDQGYTYLSLLLNNKAEFILEYNESKEKSLKRDDVDWSQSRVIFISPKYTDYQKHSVNFKDVPFELWEIQKYKNGTVGLIQHQAESRESIQATSSGQSDSVLKSVSKQVKIYDEEYHLTKSKSRPPEIPELYYKVKERILDLGEDIEMKYLAQTIQFKVNRSIVDLIIYNSGIIAVINMKKGELDDPRGETKDVSEKGHWGNGDYKYKFTPGKELEYGIYLIKQAYDKHQSN
jgi:predicted transport protein